jgi:hypothetical protein
MRKLTQKKILAKFLAPRPSKGMKMKKNKEKFGLRMDYTQRAPPSFILRVDKGAIH